MSPEPHLGPLSINEPPRISALYADYASGKTLTLGEMTTIAHLPHVDMEKYMAENKGEPVDYNRLMEAKLLLYEPIMDSLSNIRPQVAEKILELKPTEAVDLAAGFAFIAERLPGIKYYAVDSSAQTRAKSVDRLGKLVESGRLETADYILHDLNDGLPKDFPQVEESGTRIAFSLWGASYLRADKLIGLARSTFDHGSKAFVNVGVNPEKFVVDNILDAMLINAGTKFPEEQTALKGVIDSAQRGAPGREFMKKFGAMLIKNTPLRSEEETRFYLEQAGNVIGSGFLDMTSGESFYHIVVPK